jgi:hypothetical protein
MLSLKTAYSIDNFVFVKSGTTPVSNELPPRPLLIKYSSLQNIQSCNQAQRSWNRSSYRVAFQLSLN